MNLFPADRLTCCIDFSSLETWLSIEPTRRLQVETGVGIHFLPLLRKPRTVVKDPGTDDDPLAVYKARRARARREFSQRELERSCEHLGITPEQGRFTFDPEPAASVLLQLCRQETDAGMIWDFVESVFSMAFRENREVDGRAISGIPGMPMPGDPNQLDLVQAGLEEAGIFLSPAYVYSGEIFQGRQHLPLLRWMMSGREGEPPV